MDVCDTECPLGQFIDVDIDNECQQCDGSCVGCENSSTTCLNLEGVDRCKAGLVYDNDTNACVSACADGEYKDTILGYCVKCAAGCSLCAGASLTHCT